MWKLKRLAWAGLLMLGSANATGQSKAADSTTIAPRLLRFAGELRAVATSMQAHAQSPAPGGMNPGQAETLARSRRDLEVTADRAIKVAVEVEGRADQARSKALTRAAVESLGVSTQSLAASVQRRLAQNSGQLPSTAFRNFDQKATQLYNLLASVLKTLLEMQQGVVQNLR